MTEGLCRGRTKEVDEKKASANSALCRVRQRYDRVTQRQASSETFVGEAIRALILIVARHEAPTDRDLEGSKVVLHGLGGNFRFRLLGCGLLGLLLFLVRGWIVGAQHDLAVAGSRRKW